MTAITAACSSRLRSGNLSRIAINSATANTHSASVTASPLPCSPGTGWLLALPSTTTRITAHPSGRSDRRWRCRRSRARARASATRSLSGPEPSCDSVTALRTIERDPPRQGRAGERDAGRSLVMTRRRIATLDCIAWRPRTWTIAIRVLTSSSAINTSATGQAAAPIWWAMLKLATAWCAPSESANANTIREPIPATSSAPAIQPTRATGRPFSPARTWVAKPLATPSIRPTAPSARDQPQIVAGGWDRAHIQMRDVGDDHQRDDHATTIKLALPRLTEDDQHKHCIDEVIGNGHRRHDLLQAPACRRPAG